MDPLFPLFPFVLLLFLIQQQGNVFTHDIFVYPGLGISIT